MKKRILLPLLLLMPFVTTAKEVQTTSPNGKLVVSINDEGGKATYSITLDGQQVLNPSALGFKANFGDFTQGLRILQEHKKTISKSYAMWQTKSKYNLYTAYQLTVEMENARQQKMSIVFSVSDNNVAFRYEIPRQKNDNPKSAVILEEATAFNLPNGTTTFLCPQIDPMKGWERTKPSYEEEYKADAAMAEKSRYGQGYTFPCLFHLQNGWMLISETGVDSHYCGSHLSDYRSDGYTIAYPQAGENNGFGSTTAQIALPGKTPWRTITVGQSLKPIMETTIAYDVVEPLYEPSKEYKGGRYTWSWLIWQDNSINWDDQVKFIDLAAAMGYEFCLVDNWWDQNIGRDRIAELSKYAQSKGVSLMLWYNSNGAWNDAPQTPCNCMDTNIARDKEMAWLKSIGVQGIKVDFFAGDKQETMKLYEDILYDANRYGIQCIFHGCTIPRGWERMFPNYVASEAVLASENVFFSEHAAIQEPFELTLHPFCRNALGTMDWGGVIMNKYLSPDNKSRHTRKTTNVFEIATAFTNQTAVQCIAMQPNNLEDLSSTELKFLKEIPTTWDDTRFIDGYPGRYVVMARRCGEKWYVAGLNAEKTPKQLTINIKDFNLTKQLNDNVNKKTKAVNTILSDVKADKKGNIKIEMQPNGGFVLF